MTLISNAPNSRLPLVSVVMCVFNGEKTVAAAINDILTQTYKNIELLISDDASTDRTLEVINEYRMDPRVRIIRQPVNLGFLSNKNIAIGQASGDYITQQDHDDRSHPTRIERQVKAIVDTEMLVSACGVRRINQDGLEIARFAASKDVVIDIMPETGLPFFFAPTMFSRVIWKQHGPFNNYFAGAFGEDNYFISSVLRSHPIAVISDCLYDYVDSSHSVTSSLKNQRALTMVPILAHLSKQNLEIGTNDLELGRFNALAELEKKLLSNRLYVAQQYRQYAARAIDHRHFVEGARLLCKSARMDPFSVDLLRTTIYWIRRAVARRR